MYKISIVFSFLFLVGCASKPNPVVEGYNPVYMPPTVHVKHCYSTWDNTPRGYVERKVCS